MSLHKQLLMIIGLTMVALILIGCAAPMATSISSMPTPIPPSATLPSTASPVSIGKVQPPPTGCLYMEFFSPSDASAYKRDQSGRISEIITPINRVEPLLRQWTLEDFEEAIYSSDKSRYGPYLPGVEAWEYLKKYLQSEDEIWTFGPLDPGFVVIREDKVFSMVVTDHSF